MGAYLSMGIGEKGVAFCRNRVFCFENGIFFALPPLVKYDFISINQMDAFLLFFVLTTSCP